MNEATVSRYEKGWMERRMEDARKAVDGWPEGQKRSAGIRDEHVREAPPASDNASPRTPPEPKS